MSLLEAVIAAKLANGGNAPVYHDKLTDATDFVNGYLNTSGTITPDTSETKTMTSPYLEIDSSEILMLMYEVPSGSELWTCHIWFDAEKTMIGTRPAHIDSQTGKASADSNTICIQNLWGPPSGAKYVRFSLRTYGEAKLRLLAFKASDCHAELTEHGIRLTRS